jgi:hypothetical protein
VLGDRAQEHQRFSDHPFLPHAKHDHLRNPLVVPKRKPIAVLTVSIGIDSPTTDEKGKVVATRWVERAYSIGCVVCWQHPNRGKTRAKVSKR